MKVSILRPILLGTLASAVLVGCGSGEKNEEKKEALKDCLYSIPGGNAIEIELGTTYSSPAVEVTRDGKDVRFELAGDVNTSKLGNYEVTYSSESCSNKQVRSVKVVVPALASASDAANATACTYTLTGTNPLNLNLNSNYIEPGFKIKDISKNVIQGTVTGAVDQSKEGDYTLTYKGEGCSNTETRLVRVVKGRCDYALSGDNPLLLHVGKTYHEPGVTVKDSQNQIVSSVISEDVNTAKVGDYAVTYQSPSCSNVETRIVKVTKAPVVPAACAYDVKGENPLEIKEGDTYQELGVTVKDTHGEVVISTISGKVNTADAGNYVVTYQGDNCTNVETRVVKVIKAPVVPAKCIYGVMGQNPLEIKEGGTYTEPGVIVKDAQGELATHTTSGEVNTAKAGDYVVTYESPSCTNTETRKVKVVVVPTKCTYELKGESALEIKEGGTYEELGVTIKDASQQTVTGTITGTVDVEKVADYTVTYGSERCTNAITRTVQIIPSKCSYELKGDESVVLDKNDTFEDPSAVIKDGSGQEVEITISGKIDMAILGDYTLTYQGEGCEGSLTRTVKVKGQECTYKLLGDSPLTLFLNDIYVDPGAEVKDKADTVIEAKLVGTESVDTKTLGEYSVEYKLEGCENSEERIVNVRDRTLTKEEREEMSETILPLF